MQSSSVPVVRRATWSGTSATGDLTRVGRHTQSNAPPSNVRPSKIVPAVAPGLASARAPAGGGQAYQARLAGGGSGRRPRAGARTA